MSKGQRQPSHHRGADRGRDSRGGSDNRALQRVEKARALYVKSEHRVANARLRLMRAEEKLARRASRLSSIEDALAAVATAVATDQTPAREAHVAAAPIEEPTTPERAADMLELAALAATPHTPEVHTNGASPADGTAPALTAANGKAPRGNGKTRGKTDQPPGQEESGRSEPRPRTGGRRKTVPPSPETTPMPEES